MDSAIFIASKLVWGLLKPETWLILLVALTAWWLWRGRIRQARAVSILAALASLAIAVFPLGQLMIAPLERAYPPRPDVEAVSGIILLGGGEDAYLSERWGGVPLNDAGERLTEALRLAEAYPDARLIATGGSGSLRDVAGVRPAGAALAGRFFLEHGLAPDRLILETRSRNTSENARYSYALAEPEPGETWLLVTSAFHMPRAMASFERAGWRGLVAWPVDHRSGGFSAGIGWNFSENLRLMNIAAKEYAGLVVYSLLRR
jgi:uncharacterized SAM-binding protein YcdF (DUF218 family)